MRYINLRFTYLLICHWLPSLESHTHTHTHTHTHWALIVSHLLGGLSTL